MDEGKGLTNVFNSLATVTQQTMKAMTEALQTIFSINIGAGWSTVAHSLV
jgi:hypothetical protein